MDLITHFLVPYIILTLVKCKDRLAGGYGGISLDFDTIFVAWIGILFPQFFIFSHRGITHSFLFAFFTSTIFLYVMSRKQVNEFLSNLIKRDISVQFTKITILVAFFGAITHLFLDYLTTKGIPLLYPLSLTRYAAEIYQAIDGVTTIIAVLVLLILYLRVDEKYKKAAMIIFMVILISFGGIRACEKINVLGAETPTLTGNYTQISAYPTSDMFTWNVLKSDSQKSSYIVSQYNTLKKTDSNIKIYQSLSVENGSYSSAQDVVSVADALPLVERFKWNSYYTVVDAKHSSAGWDLTYYNIIDSWTGNNITVFIP
jgi:inner membrane protein